MNEARYSRLTREFPERADVLFSATRTRPRPATSTCEAKKFQKTRGFFA